MMMVKCEHLVVRMAKCGKSGCKDGEESGCEDGW